MRSTLKNRNPVFQKKDLLTIYGYDAEGDSSTLLQKNKKIREKSAGFHIDPVKTIWGSRLSMGTKKV